MNRYSVKTAQSSRAWTLAFLLAASVLCLAADSGRDVPPPEYFAGKYEVIGRRPDSNVTYSGTVELKPAANGTFVMIRRIDSHEIQGTATIEDSGIDHARVLRLRFAENGHECEGSFLWRGDLDNYARLSGRIFERGKTKKEGLEAWFAVIDRPK